MRDGGAFGCCCWGVGMNPPLKPKIYHITHVKNLPSILARGGLFSDAQMNIHGGPATAVGMSTIKQRRLTLPVACYPGLMVGDCVPFYFCPRSVMLYVLHRGNHPQLAYRGGQEPILHLEADLRSTVAWAQANGRAWAFSLSNAGSRYACFRDDLDRLGDIDWAAVFSRDFRSPQVKEGKQAEFLVQDSFPWELITRIGVYSQTVARQVTAAIARAQHQPVIQVIRSWYY